MQTRAALVIGTGLSVLKIAALAATGTGLMGGSLLALTSNAAHADVLVATRTLRAATPIEPGDVTLVDAPAPPGSATDPQQAIGMEARVTLYAGRPIPLASLAPPAMVERNQTVLLTFSQGGLEIRTEGRALGRAGEGDLVRVMNLGSRSTVSGRVTGPGTVQVMP
ncbi:MAG: flagellar basal body P-ring formation chaperone FlgA [Pararhodobacter sp.]